MSSDKRARYFSPRRTICRPRPSPEGRGHFGLRSTSFSLECREGEIVVDERAIEFDTRTLKLITRTSKPLDQPYTFLIFHPFPFERVLPIVRVASKTCGHRAWRRNKSECRLGNAAKGSCRPSKECKRSAHQVAPGRGKSVAGLWHVWRKRTGRPRSGHRPNQIESPLYTHDIVHCLTCGNPAPTVSRNELSRV